MARPKKATPATSDLVSFDEDILDSEDFQSTTDEIETEESFYAEEIIDPEDLEEVTEKKKPAKRAKSTTTKGHYVRNADLLPEVIRSKELGRITNELAKMLMLIAERYSCKASFVGYSFREDMVSFALVNLMAKALKFNPEKSNNPFSFYTTAIHNSFLQYLNEERKHRDIRDQLIVDEGLNPSFNFSDSGKDESNSDY